MYLLQIWVRFTLLKQHFRRKIYFFYISGNLKIYSFGKHSSAADVRKLHEQGKEQDEILDFMIQHSYDNFRLELSDLQMLMAKSDENWDSAIKESKISDMHLLNPLSLIVIENYFKYPDYFEYIFCF